MNVYVSNELYAEMVKDFGVNMIPSYVVPVDSRKALRDLEVASEVEDRLNGVRRLAPRDDLIEGMRL